MPCLLLDGLTIVYLLLKMFPVVFSLKSQQAQGTLSPGKSYDRRCCKNPHRKRPRPFPVSNHGFKSLHHQFVYLIQEKHAQVGSSQVHKRSVTMSLLNGGDFESEDDPKLCPSLTHLSRWDNCKTIQPNIFLSKCWAGFESKLLIFKKLCYGNWKLFTDALLKHSMKYSVTNKCL